MSSNVGLDAGYLKEISSTKLLFPSGPGVEKFLMPLSASCSFSAVIGKHSSSVVISLAVKRGSAYIRGVFLFIGFSISYISFQKVSTLLGLGTILL